ncbi:MAG: hypothetical protein Q7U04_08585 [Bacteriovorax sp.]|nr:hypothetical protein [Bacteriovorax sp.]
MKIGKSELFNIKFSLKEKCLAKIVIDINIDIIEDKLRANPPNKKAFVGDLPAFTCSEVNFISVELFMAYKTAKETKSPTNKIVASTVNS